MFSAQVARGADELKVRGRVSFARWHEKIVATGDIGRYLDRAHNKHVRNCEDRGLDALTRDEYERATWDTRRNRPRVRWCTAWRRACRARLPPVEPA